MRPKRQVTAVLLMAAFTAVGCTKRDTPSTKAQQPQDSAQSKPVAAVSELPPLAGTDEEGFVKDTTPKVKGHASFTDGEAAYKAKNYTEAATIFEDYTTQKPANAWGHFMLGLSTWKAGDLDKSQKAFETALTIDPDHLKSLLNLSRVLIEKTQYDDAINTLMRAGDIEPNSTDVYRLLGRAYRAQGKTDDAVDAYTRAIELDDKDAWSMNNLGLVLLEKKRADEALPFLAKAVELKKDVAVFHNNLGMALEHTGRFAAAATAYGNAVTAAPSYAKAKQNLARVEAVTKGPEEPFEAGTTAKSVTKDAQVTASK
jgi:tetratricopeptide (TPR) repeat protein